MDLVTTFYNKVVKEDIPKKGKSLNTSFGRVKIIKNGSNIEIQTKDITISFSKNNDQVSYSIFYNNLDTKQDYSIMNITDTITTASVAYMRDEKFYQVFLHQIIVKHLPLIKNIREEYFIDNNIIFKRVNCIDGKEYFQGYDLRLNNSSRYFKIRNGEDKQERTFKIPLGDNINSVIVKYNEAIKKAHTFELTDLGFDDNIPTFITEDDEDRNLAILFTMKYEYLGNIEKLNQNINLNLLDEILRKMGLVYPGIIQTRKLTNNSGN